MISNHPLMRVWCKDSETCRHLIYKWDPLFCFVILFYKWILEISKINFVSKFRQDTYRLIGYMLCHSFDYPDTVHWCSAIIKENCTCTSSKTITNTMTIAVPAIASSVCFIKIYHLAFSVCRLLNCLRSEILIWDDNMMVAESLTETWFISVCCAWNRHWLFGSDVPTNEYCFLNLPDVRYTIY